MLTLYAPQDGGWMPVLVPSQARAEALISQGYRREMPGAVIPVAAPLPAPGGGAEAEADADADDRLNVNLATLDELVALEGVGITIARKVQEVQGSIESIEDLIEVSNRPNWLELAPSLRFA